MALNLGGPSFIYMPMALGAQLPLPTPRPWAMGGLLFLWAPTRARCVAVASAAELITLTHRRPIWVGGQRTGVGGLEEVGVGVWGRSAQRALAGGRWQAN